MTDVHEYACMICGNTLVYGESAKEQECIYCSENSTSPIFCPEGHFVCDSCHSADALDFLKLLAENETSTDPREIVETAFRHPSVKFHGPEHHSLVPAALLIAMKNRGILTQDEKPITTKTVLEGIRRGSKIPGGFCGYAGNCGACVGSGIAVALYLSSTPKKGSQRKGAHHATIEALKLVEDGLIRCCKRSTLYGLAAAIKVLKEEHGVDLGPLPPVHSCENAERNRDCEREACYYYKST